MVYSPNKYRETEGIKVGILYGMSEWGLKRDLDGKTRAQGKEWDIEVCKTLIARFHANFKVLSAWLDKMKAFAYRNKYIGNAFGFRRPLPQIDSNEYKERNGAFRMAVNTPVQGTASLIMIMGIATAMKKMDPTRAKFIMTVHDSVVVEVRNDYLQDAAAILEHSLTHPLINGKPIDFLCIPLVADAEVGKRYGTLKKYKDFKKIG